jgi:small-conductance mechanosensitive channel
MALAVVTCACPALSQKKETLTPQQPTIVRPDVTSPIEQKPVVLGGQTLFQVCGALSFSAEARAEAISRRLEALVKDVTFDPRSLSVNDDAATTNIMAGDRVIVSVTEFDSAMAGLPRHELAVADAKRMSEAIAKQRKAYSAKTLALGSAKTVGLLLVLLVLLRLMSIGFPRLYTKLDQWRNTVIPSVRIQKFELLPSTRITDLLLGAARFLRLALTLTLLYGFLSLALGFFPWTQGYAQQLVAYMVQPLRLMAHAFVDYLPNLFYIALIVLLAVYAIKLLRVVFAEMGKTTISISGFHPEWAAPTYKIARFLVIVLAAVAAFPYLPGAKSPAFQGISIFLGVLLSLGSSSAVANIVAGVILTYMRAFKCGDRVQITDTVGDVIESSLHVTRIRTIKNVEITIANSKVLDAHIVNYTASAAAGGLILNTTVTIGYETPWREVHALLLEAAGATTNVLKDPKPFILQTALDDFYVHYELNAYTDKPAVMAVTYSNLHAAIHDAFNAAGVEIMSPHYSSMRDGNRITLPDDKLPENYEAPRFRMGLGGLGRKPGNSAQE